MLYDDCAVSTRMPRRRKHLGDGLGRGGALKEVFTDTL
jgi:hypothetical protein